MRRLWLLTALALAACSKPAPYVAPANAPDANTAPAPAVTPGPKLAQIFTSDILGANVAYLETITGPAFSNDAGTRIYKVDGCEIIVGAKGGKIANIGIRGYSPRCSFPIAQYFAGGYQFPLPNTPTFGDIKKGLGGDWGADCLTQCGNAADPVVTFTYQGSHADNFNNLRATISVRADPALSAYSDWGNKLIAKHGQAWVVAGKFNKGDSLDPVATQDFAAIRPDTIRVGQNLPGPGAGSPGG